MDERALPDGYRFTEDIAGEEVIALRALVGWATREHERWDENIARSLMAAGVRAPCDTLVAVGFLAGNVWHAVLCDLCVHPEHRGRGLARSLVVRRVVRARALGVRYLYTSLARDNPLESLYNELGLTSEYRSLYADLGAPAGLSPR